MSTTDFAAAIAATIPQGDPHSQERLEWCKAAAEAIAQVCLDHTGGPKDIASIASTCDGVRAAYTHSMNYLRGKAPKAC